MYVDIQMSKKYLWMFSSNFKTGKNTCILLKEILFFFIWTMLTCCDVYTITTSWSSVSHCNNFITFV